LFFSFEKKFFLSFFIRKMLNFLVYLYFHYRILLLNFIQIILYLTGFQHPKHLVFSNNPNLNVSAGHLSLIKNLFLPIQNP